MNEREYVHYARIESDYNSMQKLRGSMIAWEALLPCNPQQGVYPSRYRVTYNVHAPTVSGNRRQHVLDIDCSSLDYPLRSQPNVRFTTPVIKHPHIFTDQRVCLGGFPLEESLAELCIRLARFFQYDPRLINPTSIATPEFYNWYQKNRSQLPLDRSPLPTLAGFVVKKRPDDGTDFGAIRIKQRRL